MSLVETVSFDDYFDAPKTMEFVKQHNEIPAIAIGVYIAAVFLVPKYMSNREPMQLRPLFKLWNLFLASFSIIGAYYNIPLVFKHLSTKGFQATVCTHPLDDYYYTDSGAFWFFAFGMSKIPELGDTLFLLAQKKPVIFLHWYHHITVLAYCWQTYAIGVGAGLYFSAMNYFVHSIMYSYYFLMCFPATRKYVRKVAILITSLQLLQMCVGVAVTVATAWYWNQSQVTGEKCVVDIFNLECAFGMYASYFILFGALFRKLYGPKPKNGAPKVKSS